MKLLLKTVLLFSITFTQTIVVQVIDKDNSFALSGANILVVNEAGEKLGCSPDSDGTCIFKDLSYGAYEVSASFIGYETLTKSITVSDDVDYKVSCLMTVKTILYPELKIISDKNSPYKNLAGSASVIDMETMKQVSPMGTQEMLEHIPGVHAFSDDGIGNSRISVGIRGLNPRRSSRVLILEDGIPIQPALYVYPNMYYNPPAERIDGMQVIKGSGSIKYGPQTMGGVINYYTRRPKNSSSTDIKLTAGDNGYKSFFGETNTGSILGLNNAFQFLYKSGEGFRDNNGFEQINVTLKSSYNHSKDRNLYLKIGSNYENSNATYTGLTEYSFEKDPTFNPKEHDNFKINRVALDLIETYNINGSHTRTRKLFSSYFDRRWWREDDKLIRESTGEDLSDYDIRTLADQSYTDVVRTGNGESNFGILRTFCVLGLEQLHKVNHSLLSMRSTTELGSRVYWERFIDNRKIGNSPNDRSGIYYYPGGDIWDPLTDDIVVANGQWDEGEPYIDTDGNGSYNEDEDRVGQSHHYETTAIAGFVSNTTDLGLFTLQSGLRFELFEQERINRLDGSTYLDKTSFVILPSMSFIKTFSLFSLFGGVHKGYTSPSSGALKVTNFALQDSGLDLKAEESWNKEIGLRSENLFSILDFEFSFFHVDINNLVAAARGSVFKNLGSVTMMGTELSSTLKISNNPLIPTFNISHTFLRTEVTSADLKPYYFMTERYDEDISGNRLPYAPTNTLVAGISWNPIKSLSFRFDLKNIDPVFTDFHNIGDDNLRIYDERESSRGWDNIGKLGIRGPVPAYSTINASASYQVSGKINLSLVAKNIEDKVYIGSRLHSNPGDFRNSSGIIPGPRRQINFSIKYSF